MLTKDFPLKTGRVDHPRLLFFCLLLSILLHLLLVGSLPLLRQAGKDTDIRQQTTFVELVEPPKQTPAPKKNQRYDYELDALPQAENKPPKESRRLADRNQSVIKEQAPKGDDVRDQSARPPIVSIPPSATQPKQEMKKAQEEPISDTKSETLTTESKASPEGIRPPKTTSPSPSAETPTARLPSLEQLTELTSPTKSRLARSIPGARERVKQRDDVEIGDEVWLNLEHALLTSFFRRFRNQIEGVWNYPAEALAKGRQGVLLLKITVNTKGELLDVDLLKSSGSDILDYEAIQAVYRGAPFGPLPKQYPYPNLKIYAHFSYQISNKFIYGQ